MNQTPLFPNAPTAVLEPYRPSNGTEGDIFQAHWCNHCANEDIINELFCDILGAVFMLNIEDEQYPKQWCYLNGTPTCTAFTPKQIEEL